QRVGCLTYRHADRRRNDLPPFPTPRTFSDTNAVFNYINGHQNITSGKDEIEDYYYTHECRHQQSILCSFLGLDYLSRRELNTRFNTIITREATNNSSSHRIHTQCRKTRRSPCCTHTPAIETNTARSVHICQGAFSFRS
ncbi:unnamed protein product, partial [Ectocarpus sp. 12 AP-2014]